MLKFRVLVTGANGFIGRTLVDKLKSNKDIEVVLFDRKKYSVKDLNSLSSLVKDCNVVYHLAGITDSLSPLLEEVNVKFTQNLVKAVIKVNLNCRIVFASSFAVYKEPSSGELVDEIYPVIPRNLYGKSKLKCERLLEQAFKKKGVKVSVLRISNVYGVNPGSKKGVIPIFFDKLLKGVDMVISGDGTQTRDFIYVDDVADSLMASAFLPNMNYCCVNVCTGEEVSLNTLFRMIKKITKSKSNIIYIKNTGGDGGYWRGSNNLAKQKLSWEPKISLMEGLRKMHGFYR